MGRPKKNLSADDCRKLSALTAQGASHVQLARALQLDTKTLRLRLKDDPAAAAAYQDGRSEEEGALVSLLRKEANAGSIAASIFLLKSRHGYSDRGSRPVSFKAPEIADAHGIAVVFADIVERMSKGEMLPDEASAVASVLELRRKALETAEFEQRLRQMEQQLVEAPPARMRAV